MMQLKSTVWKATLVFTLFLILTGKPGLCSSVEAQTSRKLGWIESIKRFFFGSRPGGTPASQKSGGQRGDCPDVEYPLTALVPTSKAGFTFVEKTVSERPTFWFYIPYSSELIYQGEFVLIDENEKNFYAGTFPLNQSAGIASFHLPTTVPALKQGKLYRWVFSVICNPDNRSGDATVNGWIQRDQISNTLSNQLKNTRKGLQKVFAYRDAGDWYEMLTTLAELQQNNPENEEIQDDWLGLMKEMGLADIALEKPHIYSLPSERDSGEN